MLLEKTAVLALIQTAFDAVSALPDATPVVSPDPLQAQLDAAKAALAEEQKKTEALSQELDALKAKESEDLAKIAKAQADLA